MEPALLLHSTTTDKCRPEVNEFCIRNAGYTFRFRIKNKNGLKSSAWSKFRSVNNIVGFRKQIETPSNVEAHVAPLRDVNKKFTTESGEKICSMIRRPWSDAFIRDFTKAKRGPLYIRKRSVSHRPFHPTNQRETFTQDSSRPWVQANTPSQSNYSTSATRVSFSSSLQATSFTPHCRINLSLFGPGQISNTPTPVKCSHSPDENTFSVQTPTKAIGESDQQSFHLISPPSVFPSLTSSLGKPKSRAFSTALPLRPCVLFSNRPGQNFSNPAGAAQDSRRSAMHNAKTSSEPVRPFRDPWSNPHTGFDSIAVSTAKATAWSRAQCERFDSSLHNELVPRACSLLAAVDSVPQSFSFPIQAEPQLTIRRIIQTHFETHWQQMAFGQSEAHIGANYLAQQCLGLRDEMDSYFISDLKD